MIVIIQNLYFSELFYSSWIFDGLNALCIEFCAPLFQWSGEKAPQKNLNGLETF